jgi:uncharacterized protein (DUF1684 family)
MTRFGRFALFVLLPIAATAAPTDVGYIEQITEWRQHFDAELIADGWLELVGRERIPEGSSSLGSSPDATIVLPSKAPKRIGQLTRHGESFTFVPETGAFITIDGRSTTAPVQLSTDQGTGNIAVQSLSLNLRKIAGEYYLNIKDANSPAIAAFKGTAWFPIDPAYVVAARFVPHDKPRETVLALTFESASKTFTSTGDVAFQLDGKSLRLESFIDGDELFLIFQDETNGTETYGGGRYLMAPLPKHGTTTLDFNKAFNPYCAVNPYVICALTPPQNRLPVRISAGARYSK